MAKDDYEYVRKGTSNLFVAVEPKAGQRTVSVSEHRGKVDFVAFIASLLRGTYATARCVPPRAGQPEHPLQKVLR